MWGFTGILGKLIHLDSVVIVWYRVLIAVVGLGIYLWFTGNYPKIENRKQLISLIFIGIIVASHWLTFYKSIQLSTASLGILCLSTTTLHVTWLDPLIMKRKFSLFEFSLSLLVIVGIYIVSKDFTEKDYQALFYGLLSAFLAALFAVSNGKIVQSIPSSTITFYEMCVGFVFISVVYFSSGDLQLTTLFQMTLSDFLWLLFLGLLCTSFAFLATIDVVKRLGAFTVSLSINLEPVYTILLAIFILKENELLSYKFYLGAAVIILVVLANGILKHVKSEK